MEKKLLTASEAATVLRISKSKVYQLIRENKLPHISIGARQIIPEDALYHWIDHALMGG